jgi:hypothetical protein
MRIVIDGNRCTGNGRCYSLFSDLFSDDEPGYGRWGERQLLQGARPSRAVTCSEPNERVDGLLIALHELVSVAQSNQCDVKRLDLASVGPNEFLTGLGRVLCCDEGVSRGEIKRGVATE